MMFALQLGLSRSQPALTVPGWRAKRSELEGVRGRQNSGRSCQLAGRSSRVRGMSMMLRQWG